MTLIIGIKCSNGIVVGADGAATLVSDLGSPTVIQQVAKLHLIEHRIIVGVSGPVGLGQLYADRVEELWKSTSLGRGVRLAEMGRRLRDAILKDADVVLKGAAVSAQFLGSRAQLAAMTSTLIALPVEGKPELAEFNYLGTPEWKTKDLPYVAIGSGQSIADPFMSFLSRVYWPQALPNLASGIFATVWTLRHAIKVNPGGLSGPITIAVLAHKGHEPEAKILDDHEREEAEQHIAAAEEYLGRFLEPGALSTGDAPPQPPSQS